MSEINVVLADLLAGTGASRVTLRQDEPGRYAFPVTHESLAPILSPEFRYLDGATGAEWPHERYVENLRSNPAPALALDQVVVHVDGNTAVVSGRTCRQPGRYRRYVDTYERREEGWVCVHACVWPVPETS